jgi:hypothetical protein
MLSSHLRLDLRSCLLLPLRSYDKSFVLMSHLARAFYLSCQSNPSNNSIEIKPRPESHALLYRTQQVACRLPVCNTLYITQHLLGARPTAGEWTAHCNLAILFMFTKPTRFVQFLTRHETPPPHWSRKPIRRL